MWIATKKALSQKSSEIAELRKELEEEIKLRKGIYHEKEELRKEVERLNMENVIIYKNFKTSESENSSLKLEIERLKKCQS